MTTLAPWLSSQTRDQTRDKGARLGRHLGLAVALASLPLGLGCADDGAGTSDDEVGQDGETESSTSADTTSEDGTETNGETEAEASTDSSDTEAETETETGQEPYPGDRPEDWCPDGPDGDCPDDPEAPLRVGVAVLDLEPDCYESWDDVAGNGTYDDEDDFNDCGCDRLCPGEADYPGPDEGEGDGQFQRIFMAGFQNNRPAAGVRGADLGLVGEGDGIGCRAMVLDQGETRVAIVAIDTVGYFYDEVVAIRELLEPQNVDYLIVHSTHNHEGPDTMGLWGESFGQNGFDPDYRIQVRTTIAAAVTQAIGELTEVGTLTVGRGDASQASLGDADKGIRNVSNDTRDPFVVDPDIDVLHFADTEGETITTLINYASHPEAMADDNNLITSDYVHALRKTVESGSTWTQAEGVEGLGGTAVFISGALGGMMTPLGIQTDSPDGDTWSTGEFEKADTIGQLLGELTVAAVEDGEVIENPRLQFANQSMFIEIINDGFKLLFMLGIFDREVFEMNGGQYVQTQMGVVEIGPVRMVTVPGELLPELAVGGYDGSQMFTAEVPLLDPNNDNPPNLDDAPEGPYLKDRLDSPYTWIIGLGNDQLGYIIPEYDFVLGFPAYLSEADGDHYEETNSIGPQMADVVAQETQKLVDFIDWL
ncbi:hypothetical protein PPSIR1_13375 [Plesiocystis pacifica SIR-1]|uniref:Neutral/alkaline non-lysosomal ceramidase N-terminal domain-containing protein n=1 Tax=Plesiocystis pacifica SIR-1 TaxID=391625 RepID=A6GEQ5_9BACT|nr:neutral/alkaline non-lysosomal ceramidase N-terminal domain-containing protein [Plesiocystis pacifica]EDM75638.1 hypothetical protein PPSIR1_13375 [Plesiocystis pacifica SIR-1]